MNVYIIRNTGHYVPTRANDATHHIKLPLPRIILNGLFCTHIYYWF